jgi:transposase-like protein
MDTHKNARLTPKGREQMVREVVDGGLTKTAAARRFNTTPKTVAKWVERLRDWVELDPPIMRASLRERARPSPVPPPIQAQLTHRRARRCRSTAPNRQSADAHDLDRLHEPWTARPIAG